MLCNQLVRYFIVLALVLAITVTSQAPKPKTATPTTTKPNPKSASTQPATGTGSGQCPTKGRQTGVCVADITKLQEKDTSRPAAVTTAGGKTTFTCSSGGFTKLLCCAPTVATRIGTMPTAGGPKPPPYSKDCAPVTAQTK